VKLAWLFVRGTESIRVERDDATPTLLVAGPGAERQHRVFRDHIELAVFEIDLERRLRSAGWELERFETERRRKRRSDRGVRGRRYEERIDSAR
jgi:hypothetical protein